MEFEHILKPLFVGAEVKLKEGVSSFPAGTPIVVREFKDGDPEKVVTDGLIPGGWIPAKKIARDIAEVRVMTYLEMMLSHGSIVNCVNIVPGYATHLVTETTKITREQIDQVDAKNKKIVIRLPRLERFAVPFSLLLPANTLQVNVNEFTLKLDIDKDGCLLDKHPSLSADSFWDVHWPGIRDLQTVGGKHINQFVYNTHFKADRKVSLTIAEKGINYSVNFRYNYNHMALYKNEEKIIDSPTAGIGITIVML